MTVFSPSPSCSSSEFPIFSNPNLSKKMGPTTTTGFEDSKSETIRTVDSLSKLVIEISNLPEWRGPLRRPCCDLARRVKLLSSLFDEVRDGIRGGGESFRGIEVESLSNLLDSLVGANELLRSVSDGSKLYQALQREKYAIRFQEVTKNIDKALNGVSYDNYDIAEEVKEQIELVHAQFRRAKEKSDLPDLQLATDLSLARIAKYSDLGVLKRLSDRLQLRTINDLKQESVALHELVISNGVDPDDCLEEMSSLLKRLKDCVIDETPVSDNLESKESSLKYMCPVIPNDFRCPISLELMRDPVIVSTGQTYERSCIQKWLDSGHKTCPKTQQNLSHTALTPNFVLKSLIAQWCETNGIEPPKKPGNIRELRLGNRPDCNRAAINLLLHKLESGTLDEQRSAAGEIRLLAKRNAVNRICIAEAGAIPLLVDLLSCPDSRTQEHAVTALLNLSINEGNKGSIVESGAISGIVEVLKNGSLEARENAAATLFSLSAIDWNKVLIGEAGAIPPLVDLLCQGSPRGKKDAATAIFNLAIYQGNKAKAVKAGIVKHLMRLLVNPSGGMVDEALAILAILASHPEGRAAILKTEPVPILVELIRTGSTRNRESGAAVLWSLCSGGDEETVAIARGLGAEEALRELVKGGTDRAKRKAASLMDLLRSTGEA